MKVSNPYLIGITGGSASGKTLLLRELMKSYDKGQVTLISQDNYYRRRSEIPRNDDGQVNFDHPQAVDLSRLADDLKRLKSGETIELKEYTFNNPDKVPREIVYTPAPVLLVEGLFVFHNEEIASQLHLKLFVDADEHIKLSRRIRRDFEERGYGLDEVLSYYESYVAPMYRRYVAPYKEDADLVLPNNRHMRMAIEVLKNHIDAILHEQNRQTTAS